MRAGRDRALEGRYMLDRRRIGAGGEEKKRVKKRGDWGWGSTSGGFWVLHVQRD
jgi:hypothetical protein